MIGSASRINPMAAGMVSKRDQPNGVRQGRTKPSHVAERSRSRNQRQRHRPNCHTENSERQLHQTKRDVQPADRSIDHVTGRVGHPGGKATVDQDIHLHCAGGDHRGPHQREHGPHTLIAPVENPDDICNRHDAAKETAPSAAKVRQSTCRSTIQSANAFRNADRASNRARRRR